MKLRALINPVRAYNFFFSFEHEIHEIIFTEVIQSFCAMFVYIWQSTNAYEHLIYMYIVDLLYFCF